MAKEPFYWQPEILAGMTTEAIVEKLKELVPAFDLNSFVAKTEKYLSCEDLTEEEYYGERAVGKKVFDQEAGHFWGMVETRPYRRARAGLA